ncbi:MAG: gamma-glutamyltransferase [Sphaerobacter sp.]|nr:gamma-glutamyltransferase [Sphaerobacter sp.]
MARRGATQRAVVMAREGMVATAHPLATAAGLDILRRGGNAMDAAIAAALVTGVTLPAMCGLGGDAFLIHYDGRSGEVTAINGSGIAPRAASRDYFVERGYTKMPFTGLLSVAVPGAVHAYFTAIERFGSMEPAALFAPAIRYAEEGFPLTHEGSRTIADYAEPMGRFPTSAAIYLPGGAAPRPGTRLRNPDLARSMRLIVERGSAVFYQGEIAEEIARFMAENGGLMTLDDLAGHESVVYRPLQTEYRGYTVYQTGLPSQGLIMLEELNILANADLAAMGAGSADAIHLMVETKKLAFADRLGYCGDPAFVDVPLETLLSPEFARARFAEIDMTRAKEQVGAGRIPERDGDTTYLCVVDRDGNAVSLIHSLSAAFGSQVVAGNTGILLNNRAGRGFTLEEGHPNVIAPGKRTMHTLNCYLITQGGRLRWVGGTPGGDGQPQWNMQVVTNLIDFGMNVQEAIEAPRWLSFPGTDPINLPYDFVLRIEGRAGAAVIAELERRGHRVEVLGDWDGGGAAQVIEVDPETGTLLGGSDPRTEGLALGY